VLTLEVGGQEYDVLYVDFSCALLTTEVFFLEADKVKKRIDRWRRW
jgi:hypothetical protein